MTATIVDFPNRSPAGAAEVREQAEQDAVYRVIEALIDELIEDGYDQGGIAAAALTHAIELLFDINGGDPTDPVIRGKFLALAKDCYALVCAERGPA